MYNSKLIPLYTAFLHNIKIFGYKIGIEFNEIVLVVEKNKYATKIANAYIVNDLHDWPKILLNSFKLKKCLFGATNIVKHRDKSKWEYRGYGIAYDGATS